MPDAPAGVVVAEEPARDSGIEGLPSLTDQRGLAAATSTDLAVIWIARQAPNGRFVGVDRRCEGCGQPGFLVRGWDRLAGNRRQAAFDVTKRVSPKCWSDKQLGRLVTLCID